jgi:hypothetical protein
MRGDREDVTPNGDDSFAMFVRVRWLALVRSAATDLDLTPER